MIEKATRIAIGGRRRPHNPRDVLRLCRELLRTPGEVPVVRERIDDPAYPNGISTIGNPESFHIPRGITIIYGSHGPLEEVIPEDDEINREDDRIRWEIENDPTANGWAASELVITTFDDYEQEALHGTDAGDLDAWLVWRVGQRLDRQQLPWQWESDRTDHLGDLQWHERYDGLHLLGNPVYGELSIGDADRIAADALRQWRGLFRAGQTSAIEEPAQRHSPHDMLWEIPAEITSESLSSPDIADVSGGERQLEDSPVDLEP